VVNARGLLAMVALGAGVFAYTRRVRPWHLHWGATQEEDEEWLWGGLEAEHPPLWSTRAVTIDAQPEDVWPWIAQLGQNKAGCYSYTWLENLVGCRMPNGEVVVSEWQHPAVGDEVWLHPKAPPLHITELERERMMVLDDGWGFILRPVEGAQTRFIVRGQGEFKMPNLGPVLNQVYWRGIFEPAHFIMERKMLLNIRRLAERSSVEGGQATRVEVGTA
jgi:hypothetical protein